jgi:phosphoribosylformylglycinamidine cyclo-ligase
LIGGETAEMPDFYQPGEYDLAGFIVGMADESMLFHPPSVSQGDKLLGLQSSGLHTNGYSLVRKLFFERLRMSVDDFVEEFGKTLGEELLVPHRNYLPLLKDLVKSGKLSALAHITGGGITDNLDRVLTPDLNAVVERDAWDVLPIFEYISERGSVEDSEMLRTFNMGIGMILVIPSENFDQVQTHLAEKGEKPFILGELVRGEGKVVYK